MIKRVTFVALFCAFCLQGKAEEDENSGALDLRQFEPLEEKVLGRLLEDGDGPFERKIKQLVAEYLLRSAIDEVKGTEEDNGRALLQGYYPPQQQPQNPQIVYVYGTPPPTSTVRTQRTRRTRRPGHHHHHHNRESSEERTTQQPIVQPVYIQQQQQPYQPQYPPQPQPPYQPQYPQQQPNYQPQYQPAYQPQTPNQRPDTPQDSLGGQPSSGSSPAQVPFNNATSQNSTSPTTLSPVAIAPQQPIYSQYPAPASPQQPYPPPAQPYPPQSYPSPVQPQQPYPQQPQAPPPVQVVYIEPTLAPGQTTTPGPTTTPRPTPSQMHVYNQVNKILDNVAWGNITGIVDNALGIRTPMPTRNFVNGILNTVFCSPINRLLGRCRG